MRNSNWIIVALALATMLLMGCGGDAENEAASSAADAAGEAAVQTAEVHDCDGGCGMKAVPAEKLVQVNDKYYCEGCAKKAKEELEGEAKEAAGDHPHG